MRPDDETPDVPPQDDHDSEHEVPPATWAGRQRSGAGGDDAPDEPQPPEDQKPREDQQPPEDQQPAEEPASPDEPQPTEESDEVRAGFTEEYDEIERELDEELGDLDEEESDDGEEPEPGADEESEVEEQPPAEDASAPPAEPGATVEADTPTLADREEAEEAALAGLRARTAEHEAKLPTQPPPHETPPPAPSPDAEASPEDDGDGRTPHAKRLWARFLAASLLIIVSVAAATSISLLVYLTDIADGLSDNDALASLRDQLEQVDGGDAQTILILGSDKRLNTKGDPGRSDTTILLRVDPDADAIALLSIPRDLRVTIPKIGVAKFNEAYSADGPELTLEVVKRLTGLEINHVVNINFTGFAEAVDAIGCVYIDVDRRYYIPEEDEISEIDIEAGYQRLCGFKALQYVRFRHDDNDLVRSARQQDFLREARQKLAPGELIRDHEELLDIFTEYTTSDISDGVTLLELLKTFLAVQSAPVREVHFPADLGDATTEFVTADDKAIDNAVKQFMGVEGTPGARPGGESEAPPEEEDADQDKPAGDGGSGRDEDKPDEPKQDFVGPQMDDATDQGKLYANQLSTKKTNGGKPMVEFPMYYPTRLAPGSTINEASRAFPIDGPDKEAYRGYKMVVDVPGQEFGNGLLSEYYGISGTDWVDAPILDNPSETRTIDGRDYLLFYDGDRLRLVGFKTRNAAYWVNNTLSQSLEEGQMLSIATSMREFDD